MKKIKNHNLGFDVYHFSKKAFSMMGFSKFVKDEKEVPFFWQELADDGRLDCLRSASMLPPVLFGCGSWDEECPEGTFRYTACIEETELVDLTVFEGHETFSMKAAESEWICFELEQDELLHSWDDGHGAEKPYIWIDSLGYSFNDEVGFHLDVIFIAKNEIYVPKDSTNKNRIVQFWMPVLPKV
ncbi:GyrI-like domain-containing protein [Tissierella pigra]|uniref:GyrI-like domain-containing protein n=1 Tax=Tissierella pigra TaxID=2607614 RepID=A0A6N7XK31_9FIRM|nr:GyrI-like domain-containing protein [Tissierella pigra]MBU5428279.1 GyrI-like domain-containing protein [Tissierella pigra]MSU02441.1 GyrI-like domain-containing protein [Tissierella pigra]